MPAQPSCQSLPAKGPLSWAHIRHASRGPALLSPGWGGSCPITEKEPPTLLYWGWHIPPVLASYFTVIAEQQTILAGSPASTGFKSHVLGLSGLTSSSLQLKTSGKARLPLSGRNAQQIKTNHWFFAFSSTCLKLLVFLGKKSHCPFLFWKELVIEATWLHATSSLIFLLSKH